MSHKKEPQVFIVLKRFSKLGALSLSFMQDAAVKYKELTGRDEPFDYTFLISLSIVGIKPAGALSVNCRPSEVYEKVKKIVPEHIEYDGVLAVELEESEKGVIDLDSYYTPEEMDKLGIFKSEKGKIKVWKR